MTQEPLALILEPEQLEAELGNDKLVIVHISKPQRYAQFHVPGAVFVEGDRYVRAQKPVYGLLPDEVDFAHLLESLGIHPDTHVVAYDDEGGGWASRLLWTLEVAGHRSFSLLNGGLVAWVNEGFPVNKETSTPGSGSYEVHWQNKPVATAEYILSRLNADDLGLLDSRTPAEFSGAKAFASRGGHIPRAQRLDWVDTMDQARNLRLKSATELRDMLAERGLTDDKEIVCYCQSHHRSSHSCIMLKSLGYERVRGYPGAWSDWGNRSDTPVETG